MTVFLVATRGDAIFGPRDLAALLEQLLSEGAPQEPLAIGFDSFKAKRADGGS